MREGSTFFNFTELSEYFDQLAKNFPTKEYCFGRTFEIRNKDNSCLFSIEVRSGNLQYLRDMPKLMKIISECLNGKFFVENYGDKMVLRGLGEDVIDTPTVHPVLLNPVKEEPAVNVTWPKQVEAGQFKPVPVVPVKEEVVDEDGEAEAVVGGNKSKEIIAKKRGRPFGSKNKK